MFINQPVITYNQSSRQIRKQKSYKINHFTHSLIWNYVCKPLLGNSIMHNLLSSVINNFYLCSWLIIFFPIKVFILYVLCYLIMVKSHSPDASEESITKHQNHWGTFAGLPIGLPTNLPLPVNPMAVTSSSFELLQNNIGFKLAINYACGVTLAMETFLNQSLLAGIGNVPSIPVVGGIVGGGKGQRDTVEQVVKYINPIVLVGSTCIQLGGICGKYNVNNNAMSVE